MARFTIPRDIYYGKGAAAVLGHLKGERVLLVAGNHGAGKHIDPLASIKSQLLRTGMTVRVFTNAAAIPMAQRITNGAKAMREFNPDWIVALGGGSTISAAKAMWILYEHPWMRFETLPEQKEYPQLRKKARFAALSTSSGTAAEASSQCILYNGEEHRGYYLDDYGLTPDISIADPELTVGMPLALTAYSGMDGLSHAMEAMLSNSASMFTDAMAFEAAKSYLKNLEPSFRGDQLAGERLHYAQCLAGMAFANAGGGVAHAMAFKLNSLFESCHTSHGCIVAVLLPHVLKFTGDKLPHIFEELAAVLGIEKKGGLSKQLAGRINEMQLNLGIPDSFSALGLKKDAYSKEVHAIAEAVAQDGSAARNARTAKAEDIEKILLSAYGEGRG